MICACIHVSAPIGGSVGVLRKSTGIFEVRLRSAHIRLNGSGNNKIGLGLAGVTDLSCPWHDVTVAERGAGRLRKCYSFRLWATMSREQAHIEDRRTASSKDTRLRSGDARMPTFPLHRNRQ
jgi:hypothetical protein